MLIGRACSHRRWAAYVDIVQNQHLHGLFRLHSELQTQRYRRMSGLSSHSKTCEFRFLLELVESWDDWRCCQAALGGEQK